MRFDMLQYAHIDKRWIAVVMFIIALWSFSKTTFQSLIIYIIIIPGTRHDDDPLSHTDLVGYNHLNIALFCGKQKIICGDLEGVSICFNEIRNLGSCLSPPKKITE